MTYLQTEIAYLTDKYSLNKDVKGKVFVIGGASGLIGSYLLELVSNAGGSVVAISRSGGVCTEVPGVKYIKGDVSENASDKIENADYIIHAASPANPKVFDEDPVGVINANVRGTERALALSKKTGAKLLFASSSEVYGENIYNRPLKEEDAGTVDSTLPRACYTESKRLAENLCVNYDRQFGTHSVIARIAFCYGGNFLASDNRVIPQFIRMALNDKKIIMKSSGAMRRSYIYVADVAVAIIKLLTSSFTGVINICGDEVVSIRQLAQTICESTGAALEVDPLFATNSQGASPFSGGVLDCRKLLTFGYVPEFNIKKGMHSSIAIYMENRKC